MSLIDKLNGTEAPKLPSHQFWAAMVEFADGQVNKTELMNEFNLLSGTSDETELDWLISQYQGSASKERWLHYVHSLFMLAEQGLFNYNNKTTIQNRIAELP